MPKVSGIFENFADIDKIPIEDIQRWVKVKIDSINLQNLIANRLLYPQVIPVSKVDLELDLAILREVVRRNIQYFLNNKKLVIPAQILKRFPELMQLVWAFIDGFRYSGLPVQYLLPIVLKDGLKQELVGSYLFIQFNSNSGNAKIELGTEKPQKVLAGSLHLIRSDKLNTQLRFNIQHGTLFSLSSGSLQVNGGLLGVIIDGRVI